MLAHHYREALTLGEAAGLDTTALREPARQAFADAAQRAFSLSAGQAALDSVHAALALTDPDSPERPGSRAARRLRISARGQPGNSRAARVGDRRIPRSGRLRARCRSRCDARERRVLPGRPGQLPCRRPLARSSSHAACLRPPSAARALSQAARGAEILDRDFERALELSQEALAIAEDAGDDELAARCLNTIGLARVHAGDAGGIEDLERSVERAESAGSAFDMHTGLNNLANSLWQVGRIEEGSARIREARDLCKRYGFASGLEWNDAELVYDSSFRGELRGNRREGFPLPRARVGSRRGTRRRRSW